MQTSAIAREETLTILTDHHIGDSSSEPGRLLFRVFKTLDGAGIPYCVLHGYDDFPTRIKSDVDCVIDPRTSPRELLALLYHNRDRIGADVVRCQGYYMVLAGKNADGSHHFLTLDFGVNCEVNRLPLYDGNEVLASRRRHGQFWIPATDVEFGAYLARAIAKQSLNEDGASRLSALYRQDSVRCAQQVARYWSGHSIELIISAARSADWNPVRDRLGPLQRELRGRAIRQHPIRFIANYFGSLANRAARVTSPDGVSIALLGPDGAGKSSIIEEVGPRLRDVFTRYACWGFGTALLGFLRRGKLVTNQPHALAPRSFLVSVMRLGYWFVYHTLGFAAVRLALARSTLVLHDRHFVDILVDQKRYRYGGPIWMLRLLWRFIPKPDLIILLDAPPDVLQARKQEVAFEVTARQRLSYLALVRTLPNSLILDAAQPLTRVTDSVNAAILRYLAHRISRRYELT